MLSLPLNPDYNKIISDVNKYNIPQTDIKTQLTYSQIKEQREKLTVRGLSGLKNIGNTCYMNSIIQCLSSTMLFSSWLREANFSKYLEKNIIKKTKLNTETESDKIMKEIENTVTYKLAELFLYMWDDNIKITPRSFKKILGNKCKTFSGFNQNDSQELLDAILNTIHDELKTEVNIELNNISKSLEEYINYKNECIKQIKDSTISMEDKQKFYNEFVIFKNKHKDDVLILEAYKYIKNAIKNGYSIILDLFTGLLNSEVICNECGNNSNSFETFNMLSIQTPENGETNLEYCINEFTKEELLTGDNKYKCDKCNKLVDAKKKIYIWDLPEILIIHLKRFKNNGMMITKTNSKIDFPLENLQLNNYVKGINKQIKNNSYELYALCEHRGGYGFGHYVSYCKNVINNKWYEFDDDKIIHIPNEDLEKEFITKNAYILFYINKS